MILLLLNKNEFSYDDFCELIDKPAFYH